MRSNQDLVASRQSLIFFANANRFSSRLRVAIKNAPEQISGEWTEPLMR